MIHDKEPDKIYSTVLIGCGGVGYLYGRHQQYGPFLSHFHAIDASPHFRIDGISDIDEGIRNEIRNKFEIPAYEDYLALLDEIRPDVVVVATPEKNHASMLKQIILFKPRLVFCEKPLACNLAEVEELTDEYRKNGIQLVVNYSRRYLREYLEIKQNILSGEFGEIQSVLVYYSRGFLHNASHYLDLMLWWFGEPDEVIGEGQRKGLTKDDPTRSVLLKFSSGTEFRLVGLSTSDTLINEIDIIGTKRRVRIDTMGRMVISNVEKHPDYDGFRKYSVIEEKDISLATALANALEHIHECLKHNSETRTPAKDSVVLHEIMNRIIERSL